MRGGTASGIAGHGACADSSDLTRTFGQQRLLRDIERQGGDVMRRTVMGMLTAVWVMCAAGVVWAAKDAGGPAGAVKSKLVEKLAELEMTEIAIQDNLDKPSSYNPDNLVGMPEEQIDAIVSNDPRYIESERLDKLIETLREEIDAEL